VIRPARARWMPGFAFLAFLVVPAVTRAQVPRPSCESCHGQLEFLRQHVSTLEEARELLAPAATLARSAHGAMTCTDCHDGFRSFPHPEASLTATCASCHDEQAAAWQAGTHALDEAATCTDCHGVHAVRTAKQLSEPEGIRAMRAACATCHYEPAIPESDPHADSVSCAGCHEPHATLSSEDEKAATNVLNQATTCGACHNGEATAWREDVHGRATPEAVCPRARPGRRPRRARAATAPTAWSAPATLRSGRR
jgi:DNA-directed RNA polymerase subunit M/transcription elongation factor TFIIS